MPKEEQNQQNFKSMIKHIGHKLSITYFGLPKDPRKVCIQCDNCEEILFEFEKIKEKEE